MLLFNKIRDKGKIISAWYRGVGKGNFGCGVVREEEGEGGEMTQTLHAHMNKIKLN
jgi:hypothetical protein